MKKILLIIGLISVFSFVGCGKKNVNQDSNTSQNISNRFQLTNEFYYIDDYKYIVVIDTETNNLYLCSEQHTYANTNMVSLTPLYDKEGKIAKLNK